MARNGKPAHHGARTKQEPPQPGDEREGDWPREKLVAMNEKFCERMKKALVDGREKLPTGSGVPLLRGIVFVSGLQFRD